MYGRACAEAIRCFRSPCGVWTGRATTCCSCLVLVWLLLIFAAAAPAAAPSACLAAWSLVPAGAVSAASRGLCAVAVRWWWPADALGVVAPLPLPLPLLCMAGVPLSAVCVCKQTKEQSGQPSVLGAVQRHTDLAVPACEQHCWWVRACSPLGQRTCVQLLPDPRRSLELAPGVHLGWEASARRSWHPRAAQQQPKLPPIAAPGAWLGLLTDCRPDAAQPASV